jgi:hypothetical protein
MLLLCINNVSDLDLPWSQDKKFKNFFVKDYMTKAQFNRIKNALIFNIPFLITKIPEKWRLIWILGATVAFDETILPFKGRIWFRQHIRGKPGGGTGIKLYILADFLGYYWWTFLILVINHR